ncbi:MAG: hypothetical protein ACTSWP_04855 [Candidatus Freyarchaeota archaeon]
MPIFGEDPEKAEFVERVKSKAKEEKVPIISPDEFKLNKQVSSEIVFKGEAQVSNFLKLAFLFRKPIILHDYTFYILVDNEIYTLRNK